MNRKSLRAAHYLGHILEAIERIERYTETVAFDGFAASDMAQDAAHGYFGVDLDIVWRTVQTNLPGLERQARQIMGDRRED